MSCGDPGSNSGHPVSDEQVKGILELKTSAEKRASYRESHGEHLNRRAVFELLDDIDTLEQALAALEARNRELSEALAELLALVEHNHPKLLTVGHKRRIDAALKGA